MQLPDDWRDHMTALVRGELPADGSWFTGGPALGPLDQIGVYRHQYRLRLEDAIASDLVGLVAWRPEDVLRWVEAYVTAHPPDSWTLNRASWAFPAWLRSQPDVALHAIEMAELDVAVQQGFEAADGTPLTAEDLATLPNVRLAPHVRLLRHSTNAYALRTTLLSDEPVPEPVSESVCLVVYREHRRMRHWVFDRAPFELLASIDGGHGLGDALTGLISNRHIEQSDLATSVGPWFRDFVRDGLLVRR